MPLRRGSVQPAAGGGLWRNSSGEDYSDDNREALADRHRIEISTAGEWSDTFSTPIVSQSLVSWIIGRRGSAARSGGQRWVHDGYLEKMGSWRKNWKRRWFVLSEGRLRYFEHGSDSQEQLRSDSKVLGEIQLVSRGADGMMVVAKCWDYSMAAEAEATHSVLCKYVPPLGRHRATTTSFGGAGARGDVSITRPRIQTMFGGGGANKVSSSLPVAGILDPASAKASSELARCFGVRCAATQCDLFVRAESPSQAQAWVDILNRQAARALQFEVATSGAEDVLSDLDRGDELRALVPHLARGTTAAPSSSSGIVDPLEEQSEVALGRTKSAACGFGLSIGVVAGDDDEVFVAIFLGTMPLHWPPSRLSPADAVAAAKAKAAAEDKFFDPYFAEARSYATSTLRGSQAVPMCAVEAGPKAWAKADHAQLVGLLASKAFTPVHRTEAMKPGDVGTYELRPGTEPGGRGVSLKQFTVVVPTEKVLEGHTHEHLLFILYKASTKNEDIQSNEAIGFVNEEVATFRRLMERKDMGGIPVMTLPLKLLNSTVDVPAFGSGGSSTPVSHRASIDRGSLAVSAVFTEDADVKREEIISGCKSFGAKPYAKAWFRFPCLNGRKVLTRTECHVSGFGVSVPLAMLNLMCSERLSPLALDKAQIEEKEKVLGHIIRAQRKELAACVETVSSSSSLEWRDDTSRERHASMEANERLLQGLLEQRARLVAEKDAIDELTALMNGYLEAVSLYERIALVGLGAGDLDAHVSEVIDPVPSFRERERFLLKRSTKKRETKLRFMPTNLSLELLHGNEMPETVLRPPSDLPPPPPPDDSSSGEMGNFGLRRNGSTTFASCTFGCPAAHSLGFKHGGLRRLLETQQYGRNGGGGGGGGDERNLEAHGTTTSVEARLDQCQILLNWEVPRQRLEETNAAKQEEQRQEFKVAVELLARRRAAEEGGGNGGSSGSGGGDMEEAGEAVSGVERRKGAGSSLGELARGKYEGSVLMQHLSRVMGEAPVEGASGAAGLQAVDHARSGLKTAIGLLHRLDVTTTQLISVAAAEASALVACAAAGSPPHRHALPRVLEAGFLVSVQSLLSTRGDELGMLEDMAVAMELLSTVTLRFVHRGPEEPRSAAGGGGHSSSSSSSSDSRRGSGDGVWARRAESGQQLVVDLAVGDAEAKVVKEAARFAQLDRPWERSRVSGDEESAAAVGGGDGWDLLASISLFGVLFEQGINEQQAVSNAIGSSSLQAEVNSESLERLEQYYVRYKAAARAQALLRGAVAAREQSFEDRSWDEGLDLLRKATASPLKTNVHLILHASNLCRQLSGVHGICCKSGKDRTSMLVTLEEARLVCDHLRVVGGRKACSTLRSFGVRRETVEVNTGQRKYAFNEVQRLFLPKCFQPPPGTYAGHVTA